MKFKVRRVDYFNTTVRDQPGEAYKLLSLLAGLNVNLLAFTAVPVGPMHTQLAIFPEPQAGRRTEKAASAISSTSSLKIMIKQSRPLAYNQMLL